MRYILIAAILVTGTVATRAIASGKTESGSYDAKSIVLYGQGPSGIVPIKVDVDGYIYSH